MVDPLARLRMRIAGTPLRHHEIATAMGESPQWLSKVLTGVKPLPEGFDERLERAIDAATEKRIATLRASSKQSEAPLAA